MLKKFYTSDFGKIITGNTPSTQVNEYWNGEYCWITPSDLKDNKYYFKSDRQLTTRGLSKARVLPPNTLLVTCIASIGKNGILTVNGACNQQINAIIPNKNFNIDYLYYLFNFNKNYMLANAGITATPLISKKEFEKFQFIAENDISVQEEISYCLSDMDLLIVNLKNLIKKKKLIKQGVMQELLTGKKRLPGFNKEWKQVELGSLGEIYNGLTGKTKNDFGWGNSKYVTFLNVLNNRKLNNKLFEKVNINEVQNFIKYGDLFFNTSSEIPEEVALCSAFMDKTNENIAVNSFCFGFRLYDLKRIFPLYIVDYFRSNDGRKKIIQIAQGSTRYNLSKEYFLKLLIPIPEYEEQKAISTIISDIDDEIKFLEQELEMYKNIKQGMMEQLLTGKIRVV